MRAGLVPEVEPDQPLSLANHLTDPLFLTEWWPSFVGLDRAEPPGPGKPLTIIDTGVDLTHEEFANRPATTALNAQSTSARDEEHGTAVASTAAAPTNGVGIVGVYPQANLQVWDASPSGDGITAGDVIQGLDAAIRSGQGVVNLSLGSHIQNPLLDAMVAVTFASGTLVVAAAGTAARTAARWSIRRACPTSSRPAPSTSPASPPSSRAGRSTSTSQRPAGTSRSLCPWPTDPPRSLRLLQRHELRLADRGRRDRLGVDGPATLDITQLFEVMRLSGQDIYSPGFDPFSGFGRLDIPTALTVAPPSIDPQEPNEDVTYLKPGGLLHRASVPLTTAGRLRGSIAARLDFGEDPRDVSRVWVPGGGLRSSRSSPQAGTSTWRSGDPAP